MCKSTYDYQDKLVTLKSKAGRPGHSIDRDHKRMRNTDRNITPISNAGDESMNEYQTFNALTRLMQISFCRSPIIPAMTT